MFDFLDNQYIRDLKTFHASHDLTRSSRRLFVAKNGRLFACQEHLTLETAQPDKGFSQKRVVLNVSVVLIYCNYSSAFWFGQFSPRNICRRFLQNINKVKVTMELTIFWIVWLKGEKNDRANYSNCHFMDTVIAILYAIIFTFTSTIYLVLRGLNGHDFLYIHWTKNKLSSEILRFLSVRLCLQTEIFAW